jgi:hypothetical protein
MRRQVEGHTQALLAGLDVGLVERVTLLDGRKSGVLKEPFIFLSTTHSTGLKLFYVVYPSILSDMRDHELYLQSLCKYFFSNKRVLFEAQLFSYNYI